MLMTHILWPGGDAMIETRLLYYFLAAAREGSVTKAAETLHITQPTLSHHMKALCDAGLIQGRREGKWRYYSLNCAVLGEYRSFIGDLKCDASAVRPGRCSA